MSLTAFLSRYTAPVAAVVREFNSTAGHWVTAGGDEDGDGGGVHLFISGSGGSKGIVTKGPKSLIGASLNNLSNGPHSIKHHPVDHTPPGAKEYPSYAEHKPTPTAPVTKQEGQQEGVKSSGKPYARLHGADQGKGAGAAEKGTAGASASAEGVHSAQEGPEPLTKEQAEAGLVKARAESTAQAAPASSGDADPRDVAATAEFEKHKQQLLHDHPDLKAHIDADTHHAGEAERWVNNEARTRLAPEHKARGSVTRNAQPYAKPQLPDAGATKATDERKAADDKEAMQAGARRMTEAAVARGKAMNDPQRADVTRVHAKQAAHFRKPAYDTPRVSDDERDARASSVEGAAWEDRTQALVAQHSGKTPDEMRYVAGNLESQHAPDAKERMAKAGIVPSHSQHVLEEAARRLRQIADDKDAPKVPEKPQDMPKAEAKGDAPHNTARHAVHHALQALASGPGLSRADAKRAQDLLAKPELSQFEARQAHRLLKTNKRHLAAQGIDFKNVPEPEWNTAPTADELKRVPADAVTAPKAIDKPRHEDVNHYQQLLHDDQGQHDLRDLAYRAMDSDTVTPEQKVHLQTIHRAIPLLQHALNNPSDSMFTPRKLQAQVDEHGAALHHAIEATHPFLNAIDRTNGSRDTHLTAGKHPIGFPQRWDVPRVSKNLDVSLSTPYRSPQATEQGKQDDFAAKTRVAMAATAAHGPTDYAARDAGRAATHKPRPVTDLASVTKTAPYVAPASGAADAPAKGSDHGRIVKDAQGTHYRIDHPDDIVAHQKQAALGREFRAKNPNASKQLMEQAASYDPAKHHVMQSFDKKGNPDRMFHVDRSDPKLAETTPVEGKAVPLFIRKHQEYEDALAAAGDDPDARAKAAVRMWQHYEPLPTAARGIEKVDKPDLEQEGRLNNAAQIAKLGERYPQMADPNHPVHEDIQRTTRTFGQRNALIGRQQALGELRNKIEDAGIKVGAHQEEHPLHDEHEAALSQIQARIDHYKGRSEALKDTAEREAATVPEIVKKHLTPGQRKEREASVKLRARYSAPTSMAAR